MTNRPSAREAIAYLKARLPEDADGSPLTLTGDDAPILQPWVGGLLVTYALDRGSHFQIVNRRHLKQDGLDESELRAIGIANPRSIPTARSSR